MHTFSGQEIVRLWEIGISQHPLDRALTLLMAAFPEASRERLALLSIGRRDAYVFALREQTFGSRLRSLAACPACGEQLEFALNTADLPVAVSIETAEKVYKLATGDGEVQFRLPNSLDLAEIAGSRDVASARTILARRCILGASRDGGEIAGEQLPETLLVAMAALMDTCDPLAAMNIPLDCTACGHQWTLLFDIVSFFWTEITAQAKRLLREVHTLASHYGWCEADILAMSAVRRQLYLEMVT